MDRDEIIGQNFRSLFRPFNKTPGIAVKVFFVSQVEGFFNGFDPVKIKMINNFTGTGVVLIDQGKTRAGNPVYDSKLPADCVNQRGFSAPHGTGKSKFPVTAGDFQEPGRSLIYMLQGLYLKVGHKKGFG
jgi:hypothetical protein